MDRLCRSIESVIGKPRFLNTQWVAIGKWIATGAIVAVLLLGLVYLLRGRLAETTREADKTGDGKISHGVADQPDKIDVEQFEVIQGQFDEDRWNRSVGEAHIAFVAGKLKIATQGGYGVIWAARSATDEDFVYYAEVGLVSGDEGLGYGIVFGMTDTRNYYLFAKQNAGKFALIQFKNGRAQPLIPWTDSPLITAIRKRQYLEVRTAGTECHLLVDGETLATYQLDAIPVGYVGVYAEDGNLSADFRFPTLRRPRDPSAPPPYEVHPGRLPPTP
jgi:hypothetical protein